jgi:hypothetical protein
MKIADIINYLFAYDALAPELIPVENCKPSDPRRYDERRKACIKYLRERNLYILDGHFTPTKAANTDITVLFNREKTTLGNQLIQVAK